MFIALAEMRRAAGRFTLLTTAVALLVLLLLFFQAVGGSLTQGLTGAVERSSADVLVYDDRARRNPVASVIADDGVADAVAAVDGVGAVAGLGLTITTADGADPDGGQADVAVVGVDPTGPGLPRELDEGRAPERPGEAVVGEAALAAGLAVGDEVVVGSTPLTVVGRADGAAFNVLPTLYVGFDDYTAIVQDRAGGPVPVPASVLAVTTADDGPDAAALAAAITEGVDGVEALDRDAAVAALPGVGTITQSFGILYVLLFIVVTIVTGVFFLILTVQKADALVLLRAVGAGRRDVLVPVLLQVVLVTGVGAAIGASAAAGLLYAARDTFGSTVDPATAAITVTAILALGLLASTGAVRRVLAIDPVDAVSASRA